ncbi:hypothetical protein V1264_014746 [Littorina saxatilis]|uniref:Uncharacterized protein n=2 Tax=Littorina saxatilis TaxID=31220 RepID=A0AAN9BT99_9CAEN
MTLERVISEMRESSHESTPDGADMNMDGGLEEEKVLVQQQQENVESQHVEDSVESQLVESEEDLRQQVSKLEQALSEKEDLIAELKEQMTLLSLQQAAVGSPRAQREATKDLEQDVQELREDLIEKDNIIQDLKEQEKCLKQALSELRRKVKEDSDLDQEVSILHQALFEKEKVIQELKETSKLLQLSQHEKPQAAKKPSSRGQTPSIDRQERMIPEDRARSQLTAQGRSTARSERSVESTESLAVSVSSDQDSDISPGQDVDIVKEMRRLRKDIKKTKAVYANESALFQEALDREPVSYIGLRSSRSPSLTFDFAEMTHDDIPNDPDQLKRMVVKLLEENKSLTTENLRLQLRIREQEALVVEMEERLPVNNPPEEWQSLFERQLLLLQKQRDELLHQVFERDSGVGLLSSKMGKKVVGGAALHQQQEDLTAKIGELEHCHQLLQQRQAELAHCQAEKRQLEQLLLLKDETERQLMRQKRLLEEELSTIEGKLQEREATLVEEKARLMRELKERDQHIFQLQTSHIGHFREPGDYQLPPVLMGRPQSASTPRVEARSQSMGEYRLGGRTLSAEAFFMQPPVSQEQELLSYPAPHEQGAQGGSFVDEVNFDPASIQSQPQGAKSRSFQDKETKPGVSAGSSDKGLTSRRHSTGSGRFLPTPIPKDPEEMYKYHRDAVERLRDKLQLEVEMAMLSEGQAAAISGYWQRHNRQLLLIMGTVRHILQLTCFVFSHRKIGET